MVTIDDEAGRNALSEPVVHELLAVLHAVGSNRVVHAIVLAGRADVFCAGASRDMLRAIVEGRVAPTDIMIPRAILDLPVPVIAAMAGHAIGGGLAIGLCADLVLIARESRYGASFMNLGFTPGMGMTRLLEHVLTRAVAHELLYTGEARRGDAFIGNAGFNYILPRADVLPKAMELAARDRGEAAVRPRGAQAHVVATAARSVRSHAHGRVADARGLLRAARYRAPDRGQL